MYNIKFTKIKNNHANLRDDIIVGQADLLPTPNQVFVMFAKSRDFEGGVRIINTSRVKKIDKQDDKEIIFTTESNSVYSVCFMQ